MSKHLDAGLRAVQRRSVPCMVQDALRETGWVLLDEASDEIGVMRLLRVIHDAGFQIVPGEREGTD